MVANVKVAFGLVKDEILPSLKEQGKSSKLLAKTVTELTTNFRSVEKAGVRAFRATQDETQKLAREIAGIRTVGEKLKLTEEEINRRIKRRVEDVTGVTAQRKKDRAVVQSLLSAEEKYEEKVRSIGRLLKDGNISRERAVQLVTRLRQQQAGAAVATADQARKQDTIAERVTATAAGYFGVLTVVQQITSQLQQQLEFENERARLVQGAAESELTFAVLNRDNDPSQQIQQVGRIGAELGFGRNEQERATLFDVAQGLQASIGDAETASRNALETALKARRAGVDLDTARELIVQGVSQTPEDPTQLLRLLFAAGELSGRDPTTIGQASPVLNLFDDKVFAAAVATSIGNVRADDIKTFVQAAGLAINEQIDRGKLGLTEDASEREVLAELRARVDPTQSRSKLIAQLRDFGLSNVRTTNSVIQLLQTYDEITTRFVPEIEKRSTVGIFDRARAGLDDASGRFRAESSVSRRQARLFDERAASDRAFDSQLRDLERREAAQAFVESGNETLFGVRTVDAEGQLTLTGAAAVQFSKFFGDDLQISERQLKALEEIRDTQRQSSPRQSQSPALTQPIPKEVE